MLEFEQEGLRMTEILRGLTVNNCHRHKPNEVVIEFTDGTRLFFDSSEWVAVSITGTDDN